MQIHFTAVAMLLASLSPAWSAASTSGTSALAIAAAPADDERGREIAEFRAAYRDGRFADALAPAQRVAELTEQVAPDSAQLGTALNNLGTVQLKLGDLPAAERNFRRSAELIEAASGSTAPALIAPLGGRGLTLAALGQHASAIAAFQSAIAISRRTAGLLNVEQLPLIDSLCESYVALGDVASVDRERAYAIQVFEQAFGERDLRVVPAITKLATWYEQTERYALAREQHEKALELGQRAGDAGVVQAIQAWRGIARTHRLAYAEMPMRALSVNDLPTRTDMFMTGRVVTSSGVGGGNGGDGEGGSRGPGAGPPQRSQVIRAPDPRLLTAPELSFEQGRTRRPPPPPPGGSKAIEEALALLERSREVPPVIRAATLIDAGDWHTTNGDYEKAVPYWASALQYLPRTELAGGHPLAQPRLLVYRPTEVEVTNTQLASAGGETRVAQFSFTVTAEGKVRDVKVVESALTPTQEYQVRRSLRDAVYAPAFADGKPVDTANVTFSSTWYSQGRTVALARRDPPPES